MSHEITETDGVVFAKGTAVPWHGIGKEVDPNLSAIQAMHEAGLGWTVEKCLLTTEVAGQSKPVDGYKSIVRTDTGTVLGIASDRYELYQNAEAFEAFQSVLDTGLAKIETAGSLKGGKVVWALARVQADEENIRAGDAVQPFVLLSHGHDGKRSVKAGFTPIRVVCNNTLTAAESSGASKLVRVFHRGDVKGNVNQVMAAMDLTIQEFRATAFAFRRMANTSISYSDLRQYVKVVLDLEDSSTNRRATNLIDNVAQLALTGRGQDGVDPYSLSVWDGYNAVTEHLTWNAGRNQGNRFSSLWFGPNKDVLQRAHSEALKLAA